MINRVILVGRMTRDPDLRKIGNGSSVANFTLALDRIKSNKNNQNNQNNLNEQQADYINCVVWSKMAENVSKFCSKGSLVGVEGRLRSRSYENAQGQKVYVVEVLCQSVQFLESKQASEKRKNGNLNNVNRQNSQQGNDHNYIQDVNLDHQWDDSMNTFDIMEDDIAF